LNLPAWEAAIKVEWQNLQAKKANETKENKLETIQERVQAHCNLMESNTKRMLNNILERNQEHIVIEKVIHKETDRPICIDRPKEVKSFVKNHFQKWTCKRIVQHSKLPERWTKQYQPKENIDPDWYKELLTPPTWEELQEELNRSPKGKAAGPSTITAELIQHSGDCLQKLLWQIATGVAKEKDIPTQWKEGIVCVIPKAEEWDGNMNNVRPITLLEVIRKITLKIVNS